MILLIKLLVTNDVNDDGDSYDISNSGIDIIPSMNNPSG